MISVGVFTNLKSGKNRLDIQRYGQSKRLKKCRSIIGNEGEVYVTGDSEDYMLDLENKVTQACRDKPDVVAIDGGDWTISTVLTMLEKHWQEDELPPVALLGGGTFNNLPKRMDIKKPFEYLQNIVDSEELNDLTVQGIKMMRVNDDSSHEHLSFSTGVGFPVELLEEIYRKKHLKYFWIATMTLRAVGSAIVNGDYCQKFNKKQRMVVTGEGNGGELYKEDKWLGLVAQSIESLGIPKYLPQPRIFRKAESEGRFHAIGTTLDFRELLMYMPAIYAGKSVQYRDSLTDEFHSVLSLNKQLKSIKIQSEELFKYQSCGELSYGDKPFKTRELYIDAGKSIDFIKDDS